MLVLASLILYFDQFAWGWHTGRNYASGVVGFDPHSQMLVIDIWVIDQLFSVGEHI